MSLKYFHGLPPREEKTTFWGAGAIIIIITLILVVMAMMLGSPSSRVLTKYSNVSMSPSMAIQNSPPSQLVSPSFIHEIQCSIHNLFDWNKMADCIKSH